MHEGFKALLKRCFLLPIIQSVTIVRSGIFQEQQHFRSSVKTMLFFNVVDKGICEVGTVSFVGMVRLVHQIFFLS